jgi:hypothetical protein
MKSAECSHPDLLKHSGCLEPSKIECSCTCHVRTPAPSIRTVFEANPLSREWRINTSSVQHVEMANALRGLQKLVGAVEAPYQHHVSFNTNAQSYNTDSSVIKLDPTFASKSTPIEPGDFDVLCGHAIHEVGHSLVESHEVLAHVKNSSHNATRINPNKPLTLTTTKNKLSLEGLVRVGEEVYTDAYFKAPVLAEYIRRGRKAYSVPSETINWADVIAAWGCTAVYKNIPPPETPTKILKCLQILMGVSKELRTERISTRDRAEMYIDAFAKVKAIMDEDANKPPAPEGLADKHVLDMEKKEQSKATYTKGEGTLGNGQPTPGDDPSSHGEPILEDKPTNPLFPMHGMPALTDEIAEAIQDAMETAAVDITSEIEAVMKDLDEVRSSEHNIPPVIWSTSKEPEDTSVDKHLYKQLIWLQSLKHNRGTQVLRGEERGTIDQSRLHRAAIDGLVFKKKIQKPHQDLKLVLLLDASGSMHYESPVYLAAHAVHKVIPESTIITYTTDRNGHVTIQVSSTSNGPNRKVSPTGNTPSGIALLATAKRFPDSLVIHFTDGGSNTGPLTETAYKVIVDKYPKASFVEVQYRQGQRSGGHKDYLGYKNITLVQIGDINEFADRLRDAIKPWTLM